MYLLEGEREWAKRVGLRRTDLRHDDGSVVWIATKPGPYEGRLFYRKGNCYHGTSEPYCRKEYAMEACKASARAVIVDLCAGD